MPIKITVGVLQPKLIFIATLKNTRVFEKSRQNGHVQIKHFCADLVVVFPVKRAKQNLHKLYCTCALVLLLKYYSEFERF